MSYDTTQLDEQLQSEPEDDGPKFPRWLKWGLLGALAAAILLYGGIFFYLNVIRGDSPDELGQGDLDAALAIESDAEGEPAADEAAPSDEPAPAATAAPEATAEEPAAAGAGAVWNVTDASELGYRVKEVLFGVDTEAVGRTNQITGALTIEDTTVTTAEFTVDVASITSDDSRRDGQFRGRIMTTDEFPEATFVLTAPIDLGAEATEGATVETQATGDLTLRGVTRSVTFDVSARLENGLIGVLGKIPVLFEDYGIDNPSFGGITTEDNGLLEFVLVFEAG